MAVYQERNIVPNVTLDRYNRRKGVRQFTVYGFNPIDAKTCESILNDPSAVREATTGVPLPSIGSVWQQEPNDLPLALDYYSVSIANNEIILTAYYTTDYKEINVELSYANTTTQIPFAAKVPTGSAVVGGGGSLSYSWSIQSLNLTVAQKRLIVTNKTSISRIEEISKFISDNANRVYLFNISNIGGTPDYWKLEGCQVSTLGPEGIQCRYQFISDPGTLALPIPATGMRLSTDPSSSNAIVFPLQNIQFGGMEWIRPPFHEVKPFPAVPPADNRFDPRNPLPPRFIALPNAIFSGDYTIANWPLIPGTPLPYNVTGLRIDRGGGG
jgi:hypothetical protein